MSRINPVAIHHPWEDPPAPGQAIEVAEGVLWLRLPLPMRLDHVNVYALDDGDDGWTLIDTGLSWKNGREALIAALDGPLAGKPVHRAVLTHHHPDHIGQAATLANRGAEIWSPRLGWTMGRMLQLDVQDRPAEAAVTFRLRAGTPPETLEAFAAERPFNFSDCTEPLPIGFRSLHEGETIRMGGRDWTIRFGQGHAPDLATFWSDGLVLSSDQVIPGISSNIGVYPTEPDADPLTGWIDSCERLRSAATGTDPLVLPGHKLPFRGLDFRLGQLIEHHHLALDRIMKALAEGERSAVGCFDPIFRRTISSGIFGLAMAEAVAHVNHLVATGRAVRRLDADGVWQYRPAT